MSNKNKQYRLSPFPHPWFEPYTPDSAAAPAQPLNHWHMHEMSKAIREKPDWKTKYKDPIITEKWRSEIIQQFEGIKLADKMFAYVLKELEWVEKMENGLQGYKMQCTDKILASKTAVPEDTRFRLVQEVQELYNSFGDRLDYHPGSNNQVIDLVHPSLFPVQYGTTVTKDDDGSYNVVTYRDAIREAKNVSKDSFGVSEFFQWLPSLMTWDNSTMRYEFTSYINNLHPVLYKSLYSTLSEIFNEALPGLQFCLNRFAAPEYYRVPTEIFHNPYKKDGKESIWDHIDEGADSDEENDMNYENVFEHSSDYMRELFAPYSNDPEMSDFDITDFKQLKIITKIASIELTPENPTYPGGSWHVEGTVNEDIIATIIYYFDNENITKSELSFRTAFGEVEYEQGDNVGVEYIYGIHDEDKMVHTLGSVTSETNKVVIWPNLYQHHVDPFELLDKSKPGHRKILCFFLCDPYNEQVIATDKVPFQRKDWWDDATLGMNLDEKAKIQKVSKNLPQDTTTAFKIREQLMAERSAKNSEDPDEETDPYRVQFSLCEH